MPKTAPREVEEELSPNLGDISPNLGDISPNLGDISPNLGDISPNLGDRRTATGAPPLGVTAVAALRQRQTGAPPLGVTAVAALRQRQPLSRRPLRSGGLRYGREDWECQEKAREGKRRQEKAREACERPRPNGGTATATLAVPRTCE